MAEQEFDYIVVGAGTAGCLAANRLSADPGLNGRSLIYPRKTLGRGDGG